MDAEDFISRVESLLFLGFDANVVSFVRRHSHNADVARSLGEAATNCDDMTRAWLYYASCWGSVLHSQAIGIGREVFKDLSQDRVRNMAMAVNEAVVDSCEEVATRLLGDDGHLFAKWDLTRRVERSPGVVDALCRRHPTRSEWKKLFLLTSMPGSLLGCAARENMGAYWNYEATGASLAVYLGAGQ